MNAEQVEGPVLPAVEVGEQRIPDGELEPVPIWRYVRLPLLTAEEVRRLYDDSGDTPAPPAIP